MLRGIIFKINEKKNKFLGKQFCFVSSENETLVNSK